MAWMESPDHSVDCKWTEYVCFWLAVQGVCEPCHRYLTIPRRMVWRISTGVSGAGSNSVKNISSDWVFTGWVLTIQCQKWIIDITLILTHPGQQFSLDISCSPSRVVLAQCSSTSYKIINPELGIAIFDTILSLLILYILSNTQTG